MKPILYPSNETAFDTNGIGILGDCVSCTVTEERNGVYELEMEYPVSGIHYGELSLRRLILAKPNPTADLQPFRIYEITRPMGGMVTVYAQHIAYDLSGIVVSPFTASSAAGAMSALKANAATSCPFTFWTDKSTAANMTVSTPGSIWALLGGQEGSVLDMYGGEYEFDRYAVKLYGARGMNRGVSIRYGKNLTDLKQEENCASVYTGVYPYWADAGGNLVTLPEKILNASGNYDFERIMPLDLSQEWQEAPTVAQLRSRAEAYMEANNIGVPKVSLTVSFVPLEQTEEYKDKALLERVSLCDTVNVEFPAMGVSATAKCIKTVYNVLLDRYDSIGLGDARTSLADTIIAQEQQIEKVSSGTFLQQAVDRATSWIVNGKGYMVAIKNSAGQWEEICSLDDPNLDRAVNVWRWNNGGFGHSSNGYNGPYSVAITQDGAIVADFITTGTLNANVIRAGILMDAAGKNYWNLETGEFALASTTTVGGSTVSSIASDAASGAVNSYDSGLNQQKIVNKLTNNGRYQGIWLSNGQLYFNGTYIQAGTINAGNVGLTGKFRVYNGSDGVLGGFVGFMAGSDGVDTTNGIGVSDATGECYVVATSKGVRMQAGSTRLYIVKDGDAHIQGNLHVTGSVTEYDTA